MPQKSKTRAKRDRSEPARGQQAVFWICAALVAGVCVVYAQVRGYEFINLDDRSYVLENPHVLRGLTSDGLRWAFSAFHRANWHPLTWMSHMLDGELFGADPAGHHLTNVVLHAVNAVLLFLALRMMTGSLWACAAVATLFAFHPLRVESVAWVSERKDVLSGLFFMLTLLAYAWYVRRPGFVRYLAVFFALALGLMSKPMLVTLPCVLLLLDIWPLRRWRVLEKLPLLALALASCAVTVLAQQRGLAVQTLESIPLHARLANALVAYFLYLWKTIWPLNLAIFYPHPSLIPGEGFSKLIGPAIASGLLLASITLLALRQRSHRPYLLVGWLWYLGMLVPVIGLVQVGSQALADRYAYLPLVGIYIAIAWLLRDWASHQARRQQALALVAAAVVLACMTASWRQAGTWRTSTHVHQHAIEVTKNNYFAHSNLGLVLRGQSELTRAVEHLESAVRIKPDFAFAHTNLGVAYELEGELGRAAAAHERAIEIKPDYAKAHVNLAVALLKMGNLDQAETHLRRAIRTQPNYALAHMNLGVVLEKQGKLEQAIAAYRRAIRLAPTDVKAHSNLGVALVRLGRLDEAVAEFERALSLNPEYATAHNNLGVALRRQGKLIEAADHFEQALRIQPDYSNARRNLMQVRAQLGGR